MALIAKDDVGNVHLLNDSWKLWYWRFSGTVVPDVNWTDNLHGLCEFDSVEKFWRQVLTKKMYNITRSSLTHRMYLSACIIYKSMNQFITRIKLDLRTNIYIVFKEKHFSFNYVMYTYSSILSTINYSFFTQLFIKI